jgi:hypothetical protein
MKNEPGDRYKKNQQEALDQWVMLDSRTPPAEVLEGKPFRR